MARIITSNSGGGDGHQDTAPLLRHGRRYQAVLTAITDCEKAVYGKTNADGTPIFEPAIRLVWTVSFKGEELGTISKKVKPSVHEKSTLHKIVKNITGRAPVSGFDVDSLIGSGCEIVADIWTTSGGEERNGVGEILPLDEEDDTSPPPAATGAKQKAAGF